MRKITNDSLIINNIAIKTTNKFQRPGGYGKTVECFQGFIPYRASFFGTTDYEKETYKWQQQAMIICDAEQFLISTLGESSSKYTGKVWKYREDEDASCEIHVKLTSMIVSSY